MVTRVRRRTSSVLPEPSSALADLFSPPTASPPGQRSRALPDIEAAVLSASARAKSGDWSGADARTLLGLYAWCHRSVYGVLPIELESVGEFRVASRAALRVLHERFDDDPVATATFIRWCWKREKERADWAAREKKDRNRMGWRLQFSDRQVTDFRVARAARRGA